MRSGTISRRELRERRPTDTRPPADYRPLVGILVLGLMILIWVAGRFTLNGESAVAVGTPTPPASVSPVIASPTPTARPSPTFHPIPLSTPTPIPSATPSPTPTPSPSATPSPTPTPTPSPIPTATAGPTPPPSGLVILSPTDGTVVSVGGIIVSGLAAPGSTITWDRPLWFDDHTTAGASGQWSFVIGLNPGDNVMTFRVADDLSTAQTITVSYQP